ncbi:MAG: mandelate racemase/muconate lactonizing enzyme family protein [Bryobacterales bacterium]|nr:mandelate racemase/muconate lactonizing enzyme family protein [Bryobacterales bacterium]
MRRRTFLGALTGARLMAQPLGGLKITRFVTHKATIQRDYLFLEIHTDGGIVGLGEGSLPARAAIVEQAIRWLEPHFTGKDPSGVEDHWDRMYYRLNRWRDGSPLMTALSAVDIALWDIEAKRLGVPVWRLLGGPVHNPLGVYYSHWDSTARDGSPAALAERAQATVEEGWTAVKWVVRREATLRDRIATTVARLDAIRKAVGDRLDLALEMFETFSPREALAFAHAVAPYKPLFIEEPTQRESPQVLGELAAKSPVPVATGEGLLTRFDFRHLLDHRGAAIIQPDVVHCGGITEMRKIANFAEVYGVELAPHQWYGPVAHVASIHAACCCRNFLFQEWDGASDPVFRELTRGTCPAQKNGKVTLPDRPGLGIEMDFAMLAKRFPYKGV